VSEWTLQGFPVLTATLVVRTTGAWVLDAELDVELPIDGPVELVVGEDTWRGTVDPTRSGAFEGRASLRCLGGDGGLGIELAPRFYRSVPARIVARDACAEAGERLAADASGLDAMLPLWARRRETLAAVLSRLTSTLGRSWTVNPRGEVTTLPWAEAAAPGGVELLERRPRDRTAVYALDGLDLLPGMTLDGRAVESVTYTLSGGALRAEVSHAR